MSVAKTTTRVMLMDDALKIEIQRFKKLTTFNDSQGDAFKDDMSQARNDVRDMLICPIHHDLMSLPIVASSECLHRFCEECILEALKSGCKECPVCRSTLSSRRYLRVDFGFAQLLAIYGRMMQKSNSSNERIKDSLNTPGISDTANYDIRNNSSTEKRACCFPTLTAKKVKKIVRKIPNE